jgi:hypothetical protein
MPRLIFHVEEYNTWSFYIGYQNRNFRVLGKQKINPHTVFYSIFHNIDELGDYLEEVMEFKPNKNNFKISLFCHYCDRETNATDASDHENKITYSELEKYSAERRDELVQYYDVELTKYRCLKYLNFVKNDTYVKEN